MPRNGPKRSIRGQQKILNATLELIAERGPSQVSINDIASEAGVGKATIYRWWPCKAAVMIEALERWCEAENPLPETGSTLDDIHAQMQGAAAIFRSPVGALIRELIADSQGDDTIATEFRERFFYLRQRRAMSTIQTGIDNGTLRKDLDVGSVVDMLYGPLWLRLILDHRPLDEDFTSKVFNESQRMLTDD